MPVSRDIMPTEKAFLCRFFCRKILNVGVKKIRNNNMVCFQLGRHPLQIRRKLRTVQMLKLIIIVF